jgi:hypothetical protein
MKVIEKKIFCVLLLFVLLISTGICLAEEPVAERPIYTEGDFWVFVNRTQFKEVRHTFLREEKDKYVFRLGKSDRTTDYYFTSDIKRGIGYPGPKNGDIDIKEKDRLVDQQGIIYLLNIQ